MKRSNINKKLVRRIEAYEQTLKNQRGKFRAGFRKPGSTNVHK